MTARVAAALLLALTAVVYAALTVPFEKKAAAAADAYRRARDERRAAQARLGQLQRRQSALRRASPVRDAARAAGDPVGATRQGIVASLEGSGLSGVRLAVRPARAPAAASVQLAVEGPFRDVVRLAGDVVRPGTGVVLERVQLSGRESRVAMSLQGVGLEASP